MCHNAEGILEKLVRGIASIIETLYNYEIPCLLTNITTKIKPYKGDQRYRHKQFLFPPISLTREILCQY